MNQHVIFSFFTRLSLALLVYGWVCFVCALLGLFFAPLVWGLSILFSSIIFYFLRTPYRDAHSTKSSHFLPWTILCVSLGASLFIIFISEPTVFSGRDQGSISDATFSLVRDHELYAARGDNGALSQPFFDLYGPGKALHFPGFFYSSTGTLITQFPVPSISFLGGFVSILGIHGLSLANALCFFVFLLGFTLACVRIFRSWRYGITLLILLLTAFTPLWFARMTLTENLAGALLAILIFALSALLARHNQNLSLSSHTDLLLILLSGGLLFFTRIEGIWIFSSLCILLVFHRTLRDRISTLFSQYTSSSRQYTLSLAIGLFLTICFLALVMSTPFYRTVIGAFLEPLLTFLFPADTTSGASHPSSKPSLVSLYVLYGLFLSFIGAFIFLVSHLLRSSDTRRFHPLLFPLLLIIGPLFLYIIDPQISNDHPWMLRRFTWAILPLSLLCCVGLAARAHMPGRIVPLTFVWALLAGISLHGLWISAPLFTYAENRTLLTQTASFSAHFQPDDLILLAPHVTGDNWSMIDAPLRNLYNRNAVYFFNADDYARLDLNAYARVFLVVPETSHIPQPTPIAPPTFDILIAAALSLPADMPETFTFHTTRLPFTGSEQLYTAVPTPITSSVANTIYRLR